MQRGELKRDNLTKPSKRKRGRPSLTKNSKGSPSYQPLSNLQRKRPGESKQGNAQKYRAVDGPHDAFESMEEALREKVPLSRLFSAVLRLHSNRRF